MPLRRCPHIRPHPLNPLHCLSYLGSHCALLICLRFRPHTGLILNSAYHPYVPAVPSRCDSDATPISALTTPYASTPLPLTILTLPWRPQDKPSMPAPHLRTPTASVLDP
ncbi:hypothetical protein O181_014202 [Austropuccinia psidii MF-1]|uniref:Uncharacterized protein n=1 Tax=Austropuccinia psidii MF-1 TaxID=1389203 RepID=A0A9Q3BZR3_9BASI|nr:hypothetical protein [Austropuccinia psidii MF-1]